MLRIALDVDGVLADMVATLLKVYEEETGIRIRREEVDSWDFWSKYGITRQHFVQLLVKTWSRWDEIKPTEEDLSEDVKQLNEIGHVDILTQRPAKTIRYVKEWLEQHDIRYRNFTWVPLKTTKANYQYDVFIDDSPRLAEELVKRNKPMLLYSQPWNASVNETKTLRRVKSLDECVEILGGGGFV